ncbi:hypothetical protein [Tardibacter chloracetimidivorans]|uniref:hypothetical protein n=1 Tax=Tardibacter chloracetimidivorans TaxID=1921510 RepID=UPI0013017F67|nr:hypothetical protein [Tardibacter chloracetimidivorans]
MSRWFHIGLQLQSICDERDRTFDGRVLVVRIGQFQLEIGLSRWCKYERMRERAR